MNNLENLVVKTIRLKASSFDDVDQASSLLLTGKIVALPTETVYGLAADGLSETAIRRVFAAKNRPLDNPLILHVHDEIAAEELFDFAGNAHCRHRFLVLAKTFWPGPLTIIAPKARKVPFLATAGLSTVAVRVPNNNTTRRIIHNLGFPLVMPSANLSTRPSPTSAEHVLATLDGRIDAVLDDGFCDVGIESTVVRIDNAQVQILRPGLIDVQALSTCLGEFVHEHDDKHIGPSLSPGLSSLHYSPLVNSVTVCSLLDAPNHWTSSHQYLIRKSDYARLATELGPRLSTRNLLLSDEPIRFAQELYQALYDAESDPSTSLIIVLPEKNEPLWAAVNDRLRRTARRQD